MVYGDMKYISIVDCKLCKNIPQKSVENIETPEEKPEEGQKIPKEVQEFKMITTIESAPHRYATSVDKLLKCPLCGTYYYYNHYDDDGEFFMDGTSDDIEVRRYDPLSALGYLESIVGGTGENVPKPLGQLRKAFLDNITPEHAVTDEVLSAQAHTARTELEELQSRLPWLMEDLKKTIHTILPNWHLKKYCVEALCNYFLSEEKFNEISELLLQHKNPVIKVESARYILGIGTGDAPVVELIHKSGSLTAAAEKFVSKNMDELAHVLYDVAVVKEAEALDYDWLMGWYKTTTRIKALYGLQVAASHKAHIIFAILGLARLLSAEEWKNGKVCRVLQDVIDQRRKGQKQMVVDAIHTVAQKRPEILSDPKVQEVLGVKNKK